MIEKICPQCNKKFNTYIGKFCSKDCYYKNIKGRKMPDRTGIKLSYNHRKKISISSKGKKLSEETKEKIRQKRKLQKMNPHTQETKEKIRNSNKEYWSKNPGSNKGKKMSEKQKRKIARTLRNKPGIRNTKLYERIRSLPQYRDWRIKVFTRDNFTCKGCNQVGGDLQAHHIKQFSRIIKENKIITIEDALKCKELWDTNNGITLCIDCHKKTDSYFTNNCKYV